MTKDEMASLKKQMTKNEIVSLINIMSYAQGMCCAFKELESAADMLQVGIDILMDKFDEDSKGENNE